MPNGSGLDGTGLDPDYYPQDLFKTGVPHKISVIKKDRALFMRVENPDEVVWFHIANTDLPAITEGHIGLRHMFTRSARYKNFRISVPAKQADP